MKHAFYLGLPLLFLAMIALAEPEDSVASLLESHLWDKRIIVLLADDVNNTDYTQQMALLDEAQAALKKRNIVTYKAVKYDNVSIDNVILPHIPASRFLDYFDVQDGFTFLLLGKDGDVKLRRNTLVKIDNITALIDAMPMRQREMQR